MKIRRATTEDTETLTQIAHEAKRYWGYPEHWIKHWEDDLTLTPAFVNDHDVYIAEVNDQTVGFYALVLKNQKAVLEHLWVAPEQIGKGAGKELFIHAMRRASAENISEVEISADPNAEGFYKKMGAATVGSVTGDMDGTRRDLPFLTIDPRES